MSDEFERAARRRQSKSRLGRICGFLLIVVIVASGFLGLRFLKKSFFDSHLPSGISEQEYRLAKEAFEVKYGHPADRIDAMSYLAEWYLAHERLEMAIVCFSEIGTSHSRYGRMARYQQGRTLLTLHRAIAAEKQFRELIQYEEASPTIEAKYLIDARQRLRHILEVELRFEERRQLLKGVVERGEADYFETIVFCFPSHLRWNGPDAVKWLEEFQQADPHQKLLNIALGRYRMGQGRIDEARTILSAIVQEFPDDRSARAAWIACLQESDAGDEADQAIESLPPISDDDPWLLLLQRGNHALQRNDLTTAANAYSQLLDQDVTNTQAWQKTSQLARLQHDQARCDHAVKMATGLGRIQNHIGKGIQRPQDPNSFLDVADLCAEIELNREGLILARYAKNLNPEDNRAVASVELFTSRMSSAQSSGEGNK